jgi:hypothetical protein
MGSLPENQMSWLYLALNKDAQEFLGKYAIFQTRYLQQQFCQTKLLNMLQ